MNSPRIAEQQNDASFDDIWDELQYRGLVHVSTDEAALKQLLGGDPITFYCGFDPTAPSLHLGNLVQILTHARAAPPAAYRERAQYAWLGARLPPARG